MKILASTRTSFQNACEPNEAFYLPMTPQSTSPVLSPEADSAESTPESSAKRTFVSYTNKRGLSLTLNQDARGYGIEQITLNERSVGRPKRGDIFNLSFTGLRPFVLGVRLPHLEERRTDNGIELDLSGVVETDFARIECGLGIRIRDSLNAVEFLVRFETDHDIAGRIEFTFDAPDPDGGWEANIYPWAENSRSLPQDGIDDKMNRHPMVPSTRYQNKLFCYAGIPAALLRRTDRSIACLYGVAKDFDYGHPVDWRGGVNIGLKPGGAPQIVSGIPSGYIHAGALCEMPVQLVVSGNENHYRQPYDLLEDWCQLNHYTAEPTPCENFKTEDAVASFLVEKRKGTPFFFENATYATDEHRIDRFGTYPANTGFNVFLDLYLGLKFGDAIWFERAATQIRWLERMQITEPDHVASGLYCPVIRKGSEPGFYQNKEYEIEVNALGAYWLLRALELMRGAEKDSRLSALPAAAELEALVFRTLKGILKHQQPDGSIPQRLTTGGQYSEAVTPAHTLNAFYLAAKLTGEKTWQDAVAKAEAWTMQNCVEPLHFIGAHPDLQPKQYEEGSIHNVARYFLEKYADTQDEHYLELAVYLQSTAFFWRCPKQISWVSNPTQGCTSEQTHFPQFSLYSYWCFKSIYQHRTAQAAGLPFFDKEARFLLRQAFHAVVTEGDWAGAYMERLGDPWAARSGDPKAYSNKYLSELAPEFLYQLMELGAKVE